MALTIFGDAGVGKSRSVFEILNSQANQREIVIYTSDEQAAIAIATALANDDDQNAVLVADECLSPARFQLMDRVRGIERRIKIDHN
jgi:predicted ATP-dependent serine protease